MTGNDQRFLKAYRTARSEAFCDASRDVEPVPTASLAEGDSWHLTSGHFASPREYSVWLMTLRPLMALLVSQRR